jgi:hypothetical protein
MSDQIFDLTDERKDASGRQDAPRSRTSRRSGHRFADNDMRKRVNRKHVPIPDERDML